VLEAKPDHAGALDALARLKEQTGDAHAALSAIEALAAKAEKPEQKAEQWLRAAKLLEARGDRDGAIERYKLALEANPKDAAAAAALRSAFAARGDVASVVALIEKELAVAEGNMAKARLHAELAKLQRTHLKDNDKAEQSAKKAAELDATNADAQLILGDIAFDAGRFLEASKYYETLIGRTSVLGKDDAPRILIRYIESVGKTSGLTQSQQEAGRAPTVPPNPKIQIAVEALQKLNVTEQDTLQRAAKAVFEYGDPATARRMYEQLLDHYGAKMVGSDRCEALYGLGESARRMGDLDFAIKPLRAAADADASNPKPLRALAKILEQKEDWHGAVRVRQRRLEMAVGAERFDLLLEIGDLQLGKLNDRNGAQKTYAAALEERPDDRKVLTRLMQLYSDTKDWTKLVEVVLRLADFVEDPKQRAKYMHTAAIVSSKQIGDIDQALTFYDRALENDPSLVKAIDEALELRRQKGDWDGVERMLKLQLEKAKEAQDRTLLPKILDQLGDLYRKFLLEPEMAIEAYEAAQAFDPDNKDRAEILAELYASDVTQYLDKAVKAQALLLRKNPYRVESYKLLRKLYTEAKRADAAWCMCQALSVLNLAEPDEERFYLRHRSESAAPAQAALDEDDWLKLAHHDQEPILTRIFALIQPVIIRARTQPLEAQGYLPQYAIDPSLHPYPVSQTLYYAQGVLGMQAPPIFQNTNDPAGLGFIHAHTPAIVIGRAAFETQVPTQSLAFVAGRHLTYYRPGYYVRHLVPTGTGLKAWLFASIKLSVPQFPIAPDLSGPVQEATTAMQGALSPADREKLASLVSKLLNAGAALDLKKWVASIDLTADRAGFLLAHDLELTTEVMRATEDAASIPSKERMKEIVLFSISEEYFQIREKLGITVES
jgi:tetratricopeptide (TPR) repeat protein